MYCTSCGKELPENSKYCNHCGAFQQNETVKEPENSQPIKEEIEKPPLTTKQMREAMKKNKGEKKKPGCFSVAITVFSLLIIFIFIAMSVDESNTSENGGENISSTVSTTEAPIKISASKLIKAYVDNEVKADMTYDDKTVVITGYVDRIDQTDSLFSESEPIVYVGTGDSIEACLRCYISAEQKALVAELEPGDKITVTGRCVGLGSAHFKFKCVNIYDGVISE